MAAKQGTLLGWLGKEKEKGTGVASVNPRSLSPLLTREERTQKAVEERRYVLGVLGSRNKVVYDDIILQVVSPVMEAWGTPDEILLPSEGETSQIIQMWASTHGIPTSFVTCDWKSDCKRAKIYRDARIQREASHIILLQGPRSSAYSALAERMQRKGTPVVISERPGMSVTLPGERSCTER
jgi:hypothetical protein